MRNLLNLQRSSYMQPDFLHPRQLQIFSISRESVSLRPSSFPRPPKRQADVPYRQPWDWFSAHQHSAGESVFKLWTLRYFKHVYFPRALLLILSTGNWFLPDSHIYIYIQCFVQTSLSSLLMALFSWCSVCLPWYFSVWLEGYLPNGPRIE